MKCVVSQRLVALLFALASVVSTVAHAHIELPTENPRLYSQNLATYAIPNETYPQLAQNVYALARHAQGGLVTVGTERGFMVYAAMATPNAHLVLIDIDPNITEYNLINIGLLALSQGLDDYIALRRSNTLDVWKQRLSETPLPLSMSQRDAIASVLQNKYSFSRWLEYHSKPGDKNKLEINSLTYLMRKPHSPENPYFSMHYPSTPLLYDTLKEAALSGKIHAGNLDLGKTDHLDLLRQYLYYKNIKISLIDLSNVPSWWTHGISEALIATQNINNIINTLSMQLTTESYVLSTRHHKNEKATTGIWRYSAFSTAYWRELRTPHNRTELVESLVDTNSTGPQHSTPPTTALYLTPTQTAQLCEQKLL